MSRPLDIGINQIKTLILKMGKLSEDSLDLAMKGFIEKEDVYVQIRSWSNTLLILSEEVEDSATDMIALYQPMAVDLRRLKTYIKIAYDLERYGRYSMDISVLLRSLGTWEDFINGSSIEEMGEEVKKVMKIANKLIAEEDESLILETSKIESRTDELYRENLNKILEGDYDIKTVMAYLLTIRYLERIADHSNYIAESMGYAITGKRFAIR